MNWLFSIATNHDAVLRRITTCKGIIKSTMKRLGIKVKGRKIVGSNKSYELREPAVPYGANFTSKNGLLRSQNTYYWDDIG